MGKLAGAMVAVAVIALMTTDASAAGRGRDCPCACSGVVATTTAMAPVPAPSPAVAQSPAAGSAQSFSYEPGMNTGTVATMPVMSRTAVRMHSAYEPGRADNKARGIYPGSVPYIR